MTRQINAAGLAILKGAESCRLHAYTDSVGVWTIGWGHTGPEVHAGLIITQQQADDLLIVDLGKFEAFVESVAPQSTDNQFSALVDFAYNVGESALQHSTLLKLHNEGQYALAAIRFLEWDHAAGKVLPGLLKRRIAEKRLYATSN